LPERASGKRGGTYVAVLWGPSLGRSQGLPSSPEENTSTPPSWFGKERGKGPHFSAAREKRGKGGISLTKGKALAGPMVRGGNGKKGSSYRACRKEKKRERFFVPEKEGARFFTSLGRKKKGRGFLFQSENFFVLERKPFPARGRKDPLHRPFPSPSEGKERPLLL